MLPIMNTNEKFLEKAIFLAKQAKQSGNLPFGAVIVNNGDVISTGQSLEATQKDVTAHAEISAIRKACKILNKRELNECVLYASGEPCIMCAAAIFRAGIQNVFVGARRNDMPDFLNSREIGVLQLTENSKYRPEFITGNLRKEAIMLFDGVKGS